MPAVQLAAALFDHEGINWLWVAGLQALLVSVTIEGGNMFGAAVAAQKGKRGGHGGSGCGNGGGYGQRGRVWWRRP
jgi:hypothetical protein